SEMLRVPVVVTAPPMFRVPEPLRLTVAEPAFIDAIVSVPSPRRNASAVGALALGMEATPELTTQPAAVAAGVRAIAATPEPVSPIEKRPPLVPIDRVLLVPFWP